MVFGVMLLLAFAANHQAGCDQGGGRWHSLAFIATGASALMVARLVVWRGAWRLLGIGVAVAAFVLIGVAAHQFEKLGATACLWRG